MSMEMERGKMIDDMKALPPEIITEILSRLPADSAIGCRCICKPWRSLIDDPSFDETHTRQLASSSSSSNHKKFGNYFIPTSSSGFFLCVFQGFGRFRLQLLEYNDHEERIMPDFKLTSKTFSDHPLLSSYENCKSFSDHPLLSSYENCSTILISSWNGLVFMGSIKPNTDMFVCNPFTREYVNLGSPTIICNEGGIREGEWEGGISIGFGYLHFTNEYKVVSVYYHDDFKRGNVSVYTLGSGKWRNKGEIPYNLFGVHGLFLDGTIHWYIYGDDEKIVSFDLADEEFRVVVPLPPPQSSPKYIDEFGVLGGCLCVTRSHMIRGKEIPRDVWILNINKKEKEEVEFLWNRKFSIPWRKRVTSQPEPYAVLQTGKILLRNDIKITSYDPKNGAFCEDGTIFPTCNEPCMIIPYTKSLASLYALGEKNTKYFRTIYVSLSKP